MERVAFTAPFFLPVSRLQTSDMLDYCVLGLFFTGEPCHRTLYTVKSRGLQWNRN